MGSTKNCMNEVCRAVNSTDWKKGWSLKSGGFATLCGICGSAYENSAFCEAYHTEESGWRECKICGKLVHCGCIASRYLYDYMDFGGIGCGSCSTLVDIDIPSAQTLQIPCDVPKDNLIPKADVKDSAVGSRIDSENFNSERLLQLTKAIGVNTVTSTFDSQLVDEPLLKNVENNKRIPDVSDLCTPSTFGISESSQPKQGPKDLYESLAHSPLGFSLSTPSSTVLPFRDKIPEGSFKARHSFQKPPKPSQLYGSETSKGTALQPRFPRAPAEGRGRNQLLPRYWPRITDQELQQLSGDLKTTIVPLFEKILSASDAGRIGRLVLPKACAEAYFPTINQSEGIPIKIQDVKGKEWTFQFRFWPNNNSRMYVLEGVTPCIQNMQLQAGDTVIFSQRDPGDQLVIGCRKAKHKAEVQNSHSPAVLTGDALSEPLVSSSNGETQIERKKSKNIKNKRLVMHNDEATELKITWEEAQALLHPSSSTQPTIVLVDSYEFEEFQEPPIFGKRKVFVSQTSRKQEQIAQCDHCKKRKQSTEQACSNNIWDLSRCSCSAFESINAKDLEFGSMGTENNLEKEEEPSGLDALANAAVLGESCGVSETSIGPTTRHPRHRPGCTCIVCIQPPSGKGKHEATCKCNVCLTVRRRFKTLMMRKKKRQTERESIEIVQDKKAKYKDVHAETTKRHLDLNFDPNHEDETLSIDATAVTEAGSSFVVSANTENVISVDFKHGNNEGEG